MVKLRTCIGSRINHVSWVSVGTNFNDVLEKCKTLRGEPELIMSCTHDSLKFLGAKWNLLNDSCMIDEVTAAACMHNIALYHDQ